MVQNLQNLFSCFSDNVKHVLATLAFDARFRQTMQRMLRCVAMRRHVFVQRRVVVFVVVIVENESSYGTARSSPVTLRVLLDAQAEPILNLARVSTNAAVLKALYYARMLCAF